MSYKRENVSLNFLKKKKKETDKIYLKKEKLTFLRIICMSYSFTMPDVHSRNLFIDDTFERISCLKEDLLRFIETYPIEIATIITFCGFFYWIQQFV